MTSHAFNRCLAGLIGIGLSFLLAYTGSTARADGPQPAPQDDAVVVNINTATAQQLAYLPGVGASKAQRIIAYRMKRPFKRVTQLVRVRGIGRKSLRKWRRYLTVSGPTTLAGPIRSTRPSSPEPAEHGGDPPLR